MISLRYVEGELTRAYDKATGSETARRTAIYNRFNDMFDSAMHSEHSLICTALSNVITKLDKEGGC